MNGTTHHLEVLYFANMWLDTRLEEEETGWTSWIGLHFLTTAIVLGWHLVNERNNIAQELHQAAHAIVAGGTNAEHWENRTGNHTLADAFAHLVLGEFLGLEELLHQGIIVLGSSLDEGLVHLGSLVNLAGWDILNDGSRIIVLVGKLLHQDHVDDLMEILTGLYRILYGDALVAVCQLEILYKSLEVTLSVIKTIYEEDHRLVHLLGVTEVVLGTYLQAVATVDQKNGGIGNCHGGDGLTYEVVHTWAVDHVQLLAIPLYMEYGAEYRITIIFFNWEVVAHCTLL